MATSCSARERRDAARAEAAENEGARVYERLAKIENQLDRVRAEKFWDRAIQEIADLPVEWGPLTPAEILSELSAVIYRGATLHEESLTPGTPSDAVVRRNLTPRPDCRVWDTRTLSGVASTSWDRTSRLIPLTRTPAQEQGVCPGAAYHLDRKVCCGN